MPIDPSIPLQIRPVQTPSILDTYAQITQLQALKSAGEERRAAALEAQAKRQREAQIEQALQAGIGIDPVTKQPTFDFEKALGRQLPASLVFEMKKQFDANAEQMARLQTANLTAAEKRAVYLAGTARSLAASGYDPDIARLEIGAAKHIGALPEAESNALLDALERDPAAIQRWAASALARPGGEAQPRGVVVGAGQQIRDPVTGALIAEGPAKPPDAPTLGSFEDYLARKAKEFGRPVVALTPRQVAQAKAEFEAAGRAPRDERLVQIIGPGGQPIWVRESQAVGQAAGSAAAGGGKPSTGAHKRALNFFNRAQQADTDLQAVEQEIANMGLLGQTQLQYAPNLAQSQTGQLYTQAQRAFTEARLRKDSGAAIPPHEFENDRRTYFAQPGDTQATLQQKARARAAVLASIAFEAGPALGEFFGEDAEGLLTGLKTRAAGPTDDRTTTTGPRPGEQRPIPNVPGGVAEYRGGKWIRVK